MRRAERKVCRLTARDSPTCFFLRFLHCEDGAKGFYGGAFATVELTLMVLSLQTLARVVMRLL